jgi:hypothetical protein
MERIMWSHFTKALRELRRSMGEGSGSYRPDLHYMRGPGPKWHAKHGNLATTTASHGKASRPVLHDIAQHRA